MKRRITSMTHADAIAFIMSECARIGVRFCSSPLRPFRLKLPHSRHSASFEWTSLPLQASMLVTGALRQ